MVKMVNITLYTFSQNFYKVKKCQRKILLRVHNRQIINQQCIWAWCCLPVISAVQRLRQEDHELEDSLGYTARPYFKNKTISQTNKQAIKPQQCKFRIAVTPGLHS
jgi:hypothetical protein